MILGLINLHVHLASFCPRIVSAREMVDVTGGHGAEGETAESSYELRKAVRKEIAAGASWIKIAISGGIATPRGDIAEALMTPR